MSQVTRLTVTSWPEVPLEEGGVPEELPSEEDGGPLEEPPEELPEDDGPDDELLPEELPLDEEEEEPEELLPEELPDELPLELPDEEELPLGGQQSASFSYWNQYSIFGCGSVPKRTSFIRTMALMPTGSSRQLHDPAPLLLDGIGSSQQSSMKSAQQRSR